MCGQEKNQTQGITSKSSSDRINKYGLSAYANTTENIKYVREYENDLSTKPTYSLAELIKMKMTRLDWPVKHVRVDKCFDDASLFDENKLIFTSSVNFENIGVGIKGRRRQDQYLNYIGPTNNFSLGVYCEPIDLLFSSGLSLHDKLAAEIDPNTGDIHIKILLGEFLRGCIEGHPTYILAFLSQNYNIRSNMFQGIWENRGNIILNSGGVKKLFEFLESRLISSASILKYEHEKVRHAKLDEDQENAEKYLNMIEYSTIKFYSAYLKLLVAKLAANGKFLKDPYLPDFMDLAEPVLDNPSRMSNTITEEVVRILRSDCDVNGKITISADTISEVAHYTGLYILKPASYRSVDSLKGCMNYIPDRDKFNKEVLGSIRGSLVNLRNYHSLD